MVTKLFMCISSFFKHPVKEIDTKMLPELLQKICVGGNFIKDSFAVPDNDNRG